MPNSVNEIIKHLKLEELNNPNELSLFLVKLSASLYQAGVMTMEAHIKYGAKWAEIKLAEEKRTDKMTDMLAMQTPEYKEWQELRIAEATIVECIMSIKKRLTNMSEELNIGQNY